MKLSETTINIMKQVQALFPETVYLVGGPVRDELLGIIPKDYDFCSAMIPTDVKEHLKNKHRVYAIGEKHGTLGFKINDELIEITTFRGEVYSPGDRKPTVTFGTDIIADLNRRDFTINAMAIRCDNFKLIDPFDGQKDLENQVLRCVGNAKIRFKEDPLRIMRGIRIAAQKDLVIETDTSKRIKHMAPMLLNISKERWMEEFNKILEVKNRSCIISGLLSLWEHDIFKYTISELSLQLNYNQNSPHHDFTLAMHTAKVIASCPIDLTMRWAALLHDIAKPFVMTVHPKGYSNYINHEILGAEMVKKIGPHLKWSTKMTRDVSELVLNHLKPDSELRIYDNMSKKFI